MKTILLVAAVVLTTASAHPHPQAGATPAPSPAPPPQATAAAAPAPVDGLLDLDAMTFGCPKAGLNAAAREAAKVRSLGTYQFSFFRIVNDSHHASYEVHFKSNYFGEPDLKYCVAVYCQQGWDPKTTKTTVTLMGAEPPPAAKAAHVAHCGITPAPAKPPVKPVRPPKR